MENTQPRAIEFKSFSEAKSYFKEYQIDILIIDQRDRIMTHPRLLIQVTKIGGKYDGYRFFGESGEVDIELAERTAIVEAYKAVEQIKIFGFLKE